ncbi:MAG: hypothetical protein MJY69_03745 [Bacteroidales bacterium]|nr:hypothetical protein [Bacteroidales bacterium]
MKRIFIFCAFCLALISCSKDSFTARYHFNVENSLKQSKATLLPDHTLSWEEGDEIQFVVRLYEGDSDETIVMEGGSVKAWSKEIQGKLSYLNSTWILYESLNGDCQKVESIALSARSLNSYVTFRYSYEDPLNLSAGWFETIKFVDGDQIISVHVPSNN